MKYTLSMKVYDGIQKDILTGKYTPNAFLTEGEIADQYKVSKAPVRTALKKLCADGYLISYPRKGYFITNTSDKDFAQIQQLRYAMESLTVVLLVKFATPQDIQHLRQIAALDTPSIAKYTTVNAQFHMAMAETAKNKYLSRYLENVLTEVAKIFAYLDSKNQPKEEQDCHTQLLDAIEARDQDAALKWLREDLTDVRIWDQYSIPSFLSSEI